MFLDMMHTDIEVYADDILVKSKIREEHLAINFSRVLDQSYEHQLKISLKKCTFRVSSKKLLGV